jgi:crossover junction endodeoxyribonuclease RuvC
MALVLGIDPGFASTGVALVELRPDGERVVSLQIVRTAKAAKKQQLMATEDNLDRARKIAEALGRLLEGVDAVAAEAMSFPRSASVAAKMAMSWGVLAALSHHRRIPVVQASPQRIKKAVTGLTNAGKPEVQAALAARYPETVAMAARLPATAMEHPFDALAAVVAALDSEVFRMARRM